MPLPPCTIGLFRHKQCFEEPGENTGKGQPCHSPVGHDGDGLLLLPAHGDHHLAQLLPLLHRGLHILAQAQFARHVVELGLVHQNPAGLGEDGLYRVLLAQQHIDRGRACPG